MESDEQTLRDLIHRYILQYYLFRMELRPVPMRILSARYAKRIKRLGWTDSLSDWFMLDPRYFVEMTPSGGFQVVPLKEEQTYTKALDEAKRNPIVPGINPLKD